VIIFVNGPFGVGKTTTVAALARYMPDALVIDPEAVGHMLWRQLPDALHTEEFELEPVWPSVTRCVIEAVHRTYGRTVLVPMTIARPPVFAELVGALRAGRHDVHHFTLLATAPTIRDRLRRRGEGPDRWGELSWEGLQVERCLESLAQLNFATHIDTEHQTPEQIATTILHLAGPVDADAPGTKGRRQ